MLNQWLVPVGVACFILATPVAFVTPKQTLPWSLRFFVLILGCAALQMSLVQTGFANQFPFMAFFMDSFDLAIAPLTYIYLRQLNKLQIPHWQYCLHFLPALVAILAMIPYWLSDHQAKLDYHQIGQFTHNWQWPSDNATVFVMLIQFLLYSPLILIEYQRRIRLYDNQIPAHRFWLHWLIVAYYGQWLILGTLAVLQFNVEILNLLLLGMLAFLISITSVLLRQPLALSGRKPHSIISESWRAQVSQSGLAHLADRLHQYMDISRCYLDAELTLKILSDQMKTQPSKLTKVFSQHLNESFYDYINKYRVEAAKIMLMDSNRKHLSVTDIMVLAGFNSNSVFYESFKRLTGQTPAKFRKAKMIQNPAEKSVSLIN